MKKNTMKNSCSNLLHRTIGSKPVQNASVKNRGKIKVALTMAIVILVGGFVALALFA
jgi:hypothetical protein